MLGCEEPIYSALPFGHETLGPITFVFVGKINGRGTYSTIAY